MPTELHGQTAPTENADETEALARLAEQSLRRAAEQISHAIRAIEDFESCGDLRQALDYVEMQRAHLQVNHFPLPQPSD